MPSVRLTQTLYPVYPRLRPYVEKLEGGKTEYSLSSLEQVWQESGERALETAAALVDVGFFEKRGTHDAPRFVVPFLYRDALKLTESPVS